MLLRGIAPMSYSTRKRTITLRPFEPSEGHNPSLFYRALACRYAGYTHYEALEAVKSWVFYNSYAFTRGLKPGEIERQVFCAYGDTTKKTTTLRALPKVVRKPKVKPDAAIIDWVDKELFPDYSLEDLRAESQYRFGPRPHLRHVFNFLYRDLADPLLCIGAEINQMHTRRLSEWTPHTKVIHAWQYIVPNPMTKETGRTKSGKEGSPRSLDNATKEADRLFFPVEFDLGLDGTPVPKDDQARRIRFLSTFAPRNPLAMVVSSGGKSLHAWFNVHNWEAELKAKFWTIAQQLGADPAGENLAQYFRLPGGIRRKPGEPPVVQSVEYITQQYFAL